MPLTVVQAGVGGTGTTDGFNNFKNRIINGAMVIDQRNAGASVTQDTTGSQYCLDRWNIYGTAASKFTVQQNAGSVTPPAGFSYYAGCTSSSAYTISSTDTFLIQQVIEGFNTADLAWGTANAKTITLSFWVRSSLTGTFGGSLSNSAFNYSYPYSYTINAANTWEQKTVTIAGPTAGTWIGATNGIGVRVTWSLGSGSSVSGTAGAWTASGLRSATGATSVVGTNGATWYITGVQLEVGSTASGFDYRPYGTELQLCQRYFQINKRISGITADTTTVNCNLIYYCTMRAAPTLGQQGVIQINDNGVNSTQSSVSITFLSGDNEGTCAQLGNFSGLTANRPAIFRLGANTNGITLSAEL